jgi:septum formation protein
MNLILASASPRRCELLRNAGFDFEVRPASIEEVPGSGETAEDFARRVARDKALKVGQSAADSSIIIGADTVVVIGNTILGKPAGPEDAARMLRLLSGLTHRVITAISIIRAPDHLEALEHETTLVTFRKLEEKEIQEYISSGEPFDKAGAYGIQGLASKFVERIEGDYSNVVGLPVLLVRQLLNRVLARTK